MDDTFRIVASAFITIMAGLAAIGISVIVKDEMTPWWCLCGHFSRTHNLKPSWLKDEPEPCDVPACPCKRFRPKENPTVPPKGHRR